MYTLRIDGLHRNDERQQELDTQLVDIAYTLSVWHH